ncbi:ATP-binding protein [Sporosarcina sp. Te-1]|uniref:ATP-binding protein n=1 Tax=Sporosarcina sp. Te-1 TaxID=2818390 RepID=UPI001A9EBAE1|nr:ATP-binding protein [Sporosarcina sp. Te-1]QTD43109.1 ATP-binding protein [Sporosarcina sp. Te-1]
MKRYAILTVGKTHSGKTTFARELEQSLSGSIVIDQDNHAAFINKYYRKMQPTSGPNTLKYTISQTIIDYAIRETELHLIICNSNRSRLGRKELLAYLHSLGFVTVIVNFDIPDAVLMERVEKTERSTEIFRSAATFEEVLARQQADNYNSDVAVPVEGEADQLFTIRDENDVPFIIQEICTLIQ